MIVIPYRDGSTKARQAAERRYFFRKPLGDRRFRAFAVRDEMVLTGGSDDGRAPRVVLRFEGLKNRLGSPSLNSVFRPSKWIEIQIRTGVEPSFGGVALQGQR